MKKEDVLKKVKDEKVEFVHCQFVDILGMPKIITIPVSKLSDAIDSNVWIDGSSIEGFTKISESDMYLKLDLDTFAVIPWETTEAYSVARIICDVYLPNGQPFTGDPRYVLKRMVEKAKDLGYTFNTGPELEFFLLDPEEGCLAPHDNAGYFDLSTDRGNKIREEITFALQAMDIDVEALHHEVAEGQHEIDFKYDNALTTADKATTLKYVVKAIAKKHGLHATFMPKPISGINGSGMHVHQSLFSGSTNAFLDKNDKYFLSDTAKHYIAGQLHYIKDFCAVTNPTVNSYKRLVPGYEAPVYKCWSAKNRSALIRIPSCSKGKEKAVRCELRCPDPSANPYLAFAFLLGSGLKGIEEKMELADPIEENLFEFDRAKLEQHKIDCLPGSLGEAIELFKNSDLVREVCGDFLRESYIESKEAEWDSYRLSISEWEKERYLSVY